MANRRRPKAQGHGLTGPITRRDFVNGVLVGTGAALLTASAPASASPTSKTTAECAPSGSPWTGYGGVGDYRWSNGNTEAVRVAAHGIRDHLYPLATELPVHEDHALVIIGGGFSGLSAAYEFSKHRQGSQTCLLLENHPVMGGEAKQNEFDVDGQRLTAPQGSNVGLILKGSEAQTYGDGRYQTYATYWEELDMPGQFALEPLAGGAETYNLPNNQYDPMELERDYAVGYYFRDHGWVRNPLANQFKDTPWTAASKQALDDFVNNRRDVISTVADADRWLDSISYYDLLDKLGYDDGVKRYIDPLIAVGNFGVCGNAISAYAAKRLTLPGTIASHEKTRFGAVQDVSFPGGNAAILRKMLKRIIPDSISGDDTLAATSQNCLNVAAFDRPGNPIRLRLGSTAVHVRHEGNSATADNVIVTYVRQGKLHKIRAKAVIMGSGGWVNRNIVQDLPEVYAHAYGQFRYGPILTANVALRNWRFFDKLGFTVARWFAGLGWHVCVRRNVVFAKDPRPLTPDSPIVLTFYIPLLHPTADPTVQGALGRAQLLGTSYADYEHQIREQMSEMFSPAGFNAQRDIAGIVLNRWGHSYFAPPLGFFFGSPGHPTPSEILRVPHGRIIFAHSELQGNMNMAHAMSEGRRGALQALEML